MQNEAKATTPFARVPLGGYFAYRDLLWEKVGAETAVADGYEGSNYFRPDCEVQGLQGAGYKIQEAT